MLWLFALFLFAGYIYSSNVNLGRVALDANREEYGRLYLDESIGMSEMVMVGLAIFLFLQGYSNDMVSAMVFVVAGMKERIAAFVSRQLVIVGVIGWFVFQEWLFFAAFERLFTPYWHDLEYTLTIFGKLWLEATVFGAMEGLLMLVVSHFLSAFVPLLSYWLLESHTEATNGVSRIMDLIGDYLPNLVWQYDGWEFSGSIENYLLVIFVISGISGIVFMFRDL